MILKFLRNPFSLLAGLALIVHGAKIYWNLPGSFLEVSFIIFLLLLIVFAILGQIRENNRIRIESELRRTEKEKSIILDSILEVVVYFDPDYKIIWQSKNAASSGLNHQFRHTSQCCHTWQGQTIACEGCAIHQSMTQRKPGEGEIRSDDGKTWWIRTYPVFNDQHEFCGLIEFSSDITKIKRADELVRRYNEELEETVMDRTRELKELNLRLSTIFDNTYQVFILLDLEGRLLEINRPGKKYLNLYHPRIQRHDYLENALPNDLREIFRQLFSLALKDKTVRTQVKLPFTRHISRWFDIRMSVVQDEDDHCSGVFINAIDINEQTRADQEMRKALEMEKDLNRLRAHFVSSVSHEFRTPLASIYSNSQLLKRYDAKWDESRKEQTFERIFSSIHHMTSLIEDVSLLGKGQSGMYKFQPDKTEIITFCHQLKEEVISTSGCNSMIEFHSNLTEMEVSIDTNLLRHILVNLLNNACKYSDPGKIVFFGLTQHDQKLHFEVKDQGIGIPENDLPHIFDPFYRAANVGKIQGSGLGMAVVKQCLDIHNGEIDIDSKFGSGTTVNVLLPFVSIS